MTTAKYFDSNKTAFIIIIVVCTGVITLLIAVTMAWSRTSYYAEVPDIIAFEANKYSVCETFCALLLLQHSIICAFIGPK